MTERWEVKFSDIQFGHNNIRCPEDWEPFGIVAHGTHGAFRVAYRKLIRE